MVRRAKAHKVKAHVVKVKKVPKAKKTGEGISYVIGPNGKKVSLHDKIIARRVHGRKGDKLLAGVKRDVWKDKYSLRSS